VKFEELKRQLIDVDLVVWDDVASTDLSSYDMSNLLTYIDQRCLNIKANIYTGNITSFQELEKIVGNRLASRIWNASEIIEFKGKDRR
jgi:DNA replication protein DnaC